MDRASLLRRYLFWLVLVSAGYFYQGANPNTNSRFDLARAIVHDHSLSIDAYEANTVDKAYHDGHYFSDKAPAIAIAGALVLAVADPILMTFTNSPRTLANAQLYSICFVLLAALAALTACYFFDFVLAISTHLTPTLAFVLTAIVFEATFVFPYSTILFSHQVSANLLFIAFAKTWLLERSPQLATRWRIVVIASIIAILPAVEFPLTIPAAILFGWLAFRWINVAGFWVVVPPIVSASVLFAYNYLAFGHPLSLGYSNLQNTPFVAGMSQGFFGIHQPSIARIGHLLFSDYRGLFYYNPVLLLAFVGCCHGIVRPRTRWLVVASLLTFVYFLAVNASYSFWQGGACIGPRHMLPALLIFATNLAFLPRFWFGYPPFYMLALLSWIFMLAGTAVSVVPPEELTNPYWQYIFPYFKDGIISISSFGILKGEAFIADPTTAQWASFNLGELLLGLTGKLSLLPLVLFQGGVLGLATAGESARYLHRLVTVLNRGRHIVPHVALDSVVYITLAILLYLVRAYPWIDDNQGFMMVRPVLDTIDLSVFHERGQWAVRNVRPYIDVFAEYPIVPILGFGLLALVAPSFEVFFGLFALCQLALVWSYVKYLRRSPLKVPSWSILVLLSLPGSVYFATNRFDMVVAIGIGVLICTLYKGQYLSSGVMLGLLTFTKWIPALYLVPVSAWLVQAANRRGLKRVLLGYFVASSIIASASVLWLGWDGLMAPVLWQTARSPNEGSFAYYLSWFMHQVGTEPTRRESILAAGSALPWIAALVPLAVRPRSFVALLWSLLFVNSAIMAFSKIFSPQWIVWDLFVWIILLHQLAAKGELRTSDWTLSAMSNCLSYLCFPLAWDLLRSTSYYFFAFGALYLTFRMLMLAYILRRMLGTLEVHETVTDPQIGTTPRHEEGRAPERTSLVREDARPTENAGVVPI